MTPQKGDIGKVYAQRKDDVVKQKRQKYISPNFSEAWVKFLDKSIAKTAASMLNAQVIEERRETADKRIQRWRDGIWTMRYLSGFKEEMLGEQIAYERQAHQARLRAEIPPA
nr:pre-rRNA-processing protein ESF2 [Cryptococcus depauperatus CBS 7841]